MQKYNYDTNGLIFDLNFGLLLWYKNIFLISILFIYDKTNYLGGKLFKEGNYLKEKTIQHTDPCHLERCINCLGPRMLQIDSNFHGLNLSWLFDAKKIEKKAKIFQRPKQRPGMNFFRFLEFF